MKRHLLKLIGISIIAVCLIFTMMGNVIEAEDGDNITRSVTGSWSEAIRQSQEYLERITQAPGLFSYEYTQGPGMTDLAFGNYVMPMSISYSYYSPMEQAMNPWGPTSEYTEYSPIGSKMPGTSVSLPSLLMGGMGTGWLGSTTGVYPGATAGIGLWGSSPGVYPGATAGIGLWGSSAGTYPGATAGIGLWGSSAGTYPGATAGIGLWGSSPGVYPGAIGTGWLGNITGQYPFLTGTTGGIPYLGSRIY